MTIGEVTRNIAIAERLLFKEDIVVFEQRGIVKYSG